VFGGVLYRHPELQIVFGEGGLSWIAPVLQDAEAFVDNYGEVGERFGSPAGVITGTTTAMATFQNDPLGLISCVTSGPTESVGGRLSSHRRDVSGYGQAVANSIVDATTTDGRAGDASVGTPSNCFRLGA